MDTEVTDTPITTVETVITTNEEIPGEPIGDVHVGEVVEAETLTEVSKYGQLVISRLAHKFCQLLKPNQGGVFPFIFFLIANIMYCFSIASPPDLSRGEAMYSDYSDYYIRWVSCKNTLF